MMNILHLNLSRQVNTRFMYPGGMEGWVDLGDLLRIMLLYPTTDGHLYSQEWNVDRIITMLSVIDRSPRSGLTLMMTSKSERTRQSLNYRVMSQTLWKHGHLFVMSHAAVQYHIVSYFRVNLRAAFQKYKIKCVPLFSTHGLGHRVSSVCGPTIWNSLPKTLRLTDNYQQFRRLLKTHLFNLAFNWHYF